jgi:hypothetical protein
MLSRSVSELGTPTIERSSMKSEYYGYSASSPGTSNKVLVWLRSLSRRARVLYSILVVMILAAITIGAAMGATKGSQVDLASTQTSGVLDGNSSGESSSATSVYAGFATNPTATSTSTIPVVQPYFSPTSCYAQCQDDDQCSYLNDFAYCSWDEWRCNSQCE